MKKGDYTTLYFEEYNKGGGRRGGRYVGEIIMSPGQRKRFLSTNLDNVKSWLDRMRMERTTVKDTHNE